MDATLLAAAGLDRLERFDTGVPIPVEVMLPAPAQGAVGVETLADGPARALVAAIGCADTQACVFAERAFLAALKADCHSPVGALATLARGKLTLAAELFDEDGRETVAGAMTGADGVALAQALAADLLARAPAGVRALFQG